MKKRDYLLLAFGLCCFTTSLMASPWQCLKDWTDYNSEWLESRGIHFQHNPSSPLAEGYKFDGQLSYKAGFWVGTATPQTEDSASVLGVAQECHCTTFVGPYDHYDGTSSQFVGLCGYW